MASTDVFVHHAGIADLFDEMAREWKGWSGSKQAQSTEGDLQFVCHSDGLGHTFVTVRLYSGPNPDRDWHVTATIRLDTQPLLDASRLMRSFFQPDRHAG